MTSWNASLERLLEGTVLDPDDSDPRLAFDWGDPSPFQLAVGDAECDNATLVDTLREAPILVRAVESLQLEEWMRTRSVVVFDIRSAEEYAAAHIPYARSVAGEFLADALASLKAHPRVVLVCRSGRRSSDLVRLWQDAEDWEIYHLKGGMLAWNGPLRD